jgi:hypothetical protein
VKKRARIDPDVVHGRAQAAALTSLARGDDVHGLMAAVACPDIPGQLGADVAMLDLAITALDLGCPPGVEPLEYESLRERCLAEVTLAVWRLARRTDSTRA